MIVDVVVVEESGRGWSRLKTSLAHFDLFSLSTLSWQNPFPKGHLYGEGARARARV